MKTFIEYWKQGWTTRVIFGFAGAGLGYLYYITIGCDGGCPITGNPWTSTAYGAFVGLLAYPGPARKKENGKTGTEHNNTTEAS